MGRQIFLTSCIGAVPKASARKWQPLAAPGESKRKTRPESPPPDSPFPTLGKPLSCVLTAATCLFLRWEQQFQFAAFTPMQISCTRADGAFRNQEILGSVSV